MAEWLRRQTRNLLGFARAGSNPAGDDFLYRHNKLKIYKIHKSLNENINYHISSVLY